MYAFVADDELNGQIQAYKREHKGSESDAVRDLLRKGLKQDRREAELLKAALHEPARTGGVAA